jgi:hypothetical protein
MSIIEKHIQEWRCSMQQKELFKTADLDELESHLREEIDSLTQKGILEDEAFVIAVHRLGDEDGLEKEFHKINSGMIWKRGIFWMLGGYFLINVFVTLIYTVQSAYMLWIHWGDLPIPFMSPYRLLIIPGILSILLICLLYFALTKRSAKSWRFYQFAQTGRQHKWLSVMTLVFIITIALKGSSFIQASFLKMSSVQMLMQLSSASFLVTGIFKLVLAVLFVRLGIQYLIKKREREEA